MEIDHYMNEGPLLDKDGNLAEPGYAKKLVKKYDRKLINAPKFLIKEWDYYYIGNKDNGIALTIADNGYMSLLSISYLDFKSKSQITRSKMGWFPLGKINMPSTSSEGDVSYSLGKVNISFVLEGNKRHLKAYYPNFDKKGNSFRCDVILTPTIDDTLVIATPFKKPHRFYYNQKINLLSAGGYAKIGDKYIDLNGSTYGVLDWGRGVWEYSSTWYWSSLSAEMDGVKIGFNFGYGFGDTKAASENIIYYGDSSYKVREVRMDIPLKKNGSFDYLGKWKFRSPTGEVDLEFTPILDRKAISSALIIESKQHQVFGLFNGKLLLDGKMVIVKDLLGFAERVHNRW